MKNTFTKWDKIEKLDIDTVSDWIVTGRKANEAIPDLWIYKHIGNPDEPLTILDFGCGFGRNTFGLSTYSKKWTIIGYDNVNMLARVPEFAKINYNNEIPNNIWFNSNWEELKYRKFDRIISILVFQHILEEHLIVYLNDIKRMTNFLMVAGRRYNDDVPSQSTWTVLERQGLLPVQFRHGDVNVPYNADGPPEDHLNAVYMF